MMLLRRAVIICEMMSRSEPRRLVALGASNLRRGLHVLLATARAEWGAEVELLAAPGLGRSYGAKSTVLLSTLPGILQSGLWQKLRELPPAPTRALITDVGNDLLYGFSPPEILGWVEECIGRLKTQTDDILLTDLPMDGIRRLSQWKFFLFRTLFFPRSRIPLVKVTSAAERLKGGLSSLARANDVRTASLRPAWYGFDPIHIRPSSAPEAWREILLGEGGPPARSSMAEALKIALHRPEQRWLLGIERHVSQTGRQLARGGRLWLY
jgi:hypothetical protein